MGKRGPPARVVPDWIWEYVELHTVGQSQPVKIALINKLLADNGEAPISTIAAHRQALAETLRWFPRVFHCIGM